jgi:lytic murein transglycosylase
MRRIGVVLAGGAVVLLGAMASAPAMADGRCHGGQSFEGFIHSFGGRAAAQGISRRTVASALGGVRFDQDIVNRDRAQGVFAQTFLQFSDRMVAGYRLAGGARQLRNRAALFARIERQYGVPGPVITAFWGLETDFGANLGKFPTLTALATLAYDCRRPQLFETQLMAALRIVDRGDLTAGEMHGAWAGELGQTQFLPTDYLRNAVDYDGDGKRDLLRSVPDVLASTAKDLASFGWRRGQPWLQEVEVPQNLPWREADLTITHPASWWGAHGVRARHGRLAGGLPASLLLPMGRDGPAFLAYPNFGVFTTWNKSLVYATTAAYFATRLAGAPAVSHGHPARGLSVGQMRRLQQILVRHGNNVGKIDGVLGEKTREAVRREQIRLGLPADSWPTPELLSRLGG